MCKVPLRVKKEEDYIDLAIDSEIKHTPPNEETIPARQKKSLNGYDKNFLEKFIKTFESSENRDMYKAEQWWDSKREFSEMINDEMSCLHETPKNTPVESNDDWREALLSTADYYVRDQVIAWLPQIYEEYIDRQKNNDSFEDWKTGNGMVYGEWYEKRLQQILTGRKLKNEPEDFNF